MMNTREMEQLVKELIRKKTEIAYIRHYLMQEFGVDDEMINAVFKRVGVKEDDPKSRKGPESAGAELKKQGRRSEFFG